jgi:hypothetical protein
VYVGGVYVGCAGLSYVGSGDMPVDCDGRVGFVYVDGRGRYGRAGAVYVGAVYVGRDVLTLPTLPPRIWFRAVKRGFMRSPTRVTCARACGDGPIGGFETTDVARMPSALLRTIVGRMRRPRLRSATKRQSASPVRMPRWSRMIGPRLSGLRWSRTIGPRFGFE